MKVKGIIALLLCMQLTAVAQTTVKIWEGTNMTHKQKKSELTLYLPEAANNTGISVIICPGGSYCYLGMKHEGHQVAEYLRSRGFAAFVLRYRVGMWGNRHPAMVQDLQRAIQWVKMRCESYGIDSTKVGVMGFSAGGHLAGTLATYSDINYMEALDIAAQVSLRPAFTAMIYPVVTMQQEELVHKRSRWNLLGARHRSPAQADSLSLEKHVREGMPPIFLLHCQRDKTVDYRNSLQYDIALSEKNIPHKCLIYDEEGHGFGIHPKGKTSGWQEEFVTWMQAITATNTATSMKGSTE
jgi:acetyl esterase/lipase